MSALFLRSSGLARKAAGMPVSTMRMFSGHHHHPSSHHQPQPVDTHVHLNHDDSILIRHQAVSMLKQKLSVLKMLNNEDFVKKNAQVYNSSVASHIRHSLDHFNAIVHAAEDQKHFADYDNRQRNTEIENNRDVAIDAVEKLVHKLHSLDLGQPIKVSFIGDDKTFNTYSMNSHVARELSFASHHAIHHMTLVKLIMSSMSYEFHKDSTIGIAPSTTKDMKSNGEL
jgi:hypothetical protein